MTRKLIYLLFIINCFLAFFRGGLPSVSGDEVASYSSLMPFFHGIGSGKFIPTFLIYYHEPMQQIIQLPVILFGASSIFVRLPNILSSILLFAILYKIGKLLFENKSLYIIALLLLYTFLGDIIILRTAINAGFFNLLLALSVYYLIKFVRLKNEKHFYFSLFILLMSVFVFIDAIFSIIPLVAFGFHSKVIHKPYIKSKLFFALALTSIVFLIWAWAVHFGAESSHLYNWQLQAPFRLFTRGTEYSLNGIFDNFKLLATSNSVIYLFFLTVFLLASMFNRRAKPIWLLLIGPLIYFNVVKMPTLHILNFISLILVGSVLGMQFIIETRRNLKVVVLAFLCLAITSNIALLALFNPISADNEIKKAASFVRSKAPTCSIIYTDLDGYKFRFYFNRGYTGSFESEPTIAVTEKPLRHKNYALIARTENLFIHKKNYRGKVKTLQKIDNSLFSFKNTLSYVTVCKT